jgi:hypothetical protein
MMKKITALAFLMVFGFSIDAQQLNYDWKKMNPQQRKDVINKLPPEDRKELLKKFRNNMVVENLNIKDADKEEFTKVYNEYLDNQNNIKKQFDPRFKADQLTDQEAKQRLQQSFDVGQNLLDNRKKYAEKLQQVIPPQKVLQLFQNEGMMRDKMNERKQNPNGNAPRGQMRQR